MVQRCFFCSRDDSDDMEARPDPKACSLSQQDSDMPDVDSVPDVWPRVPLLAMVGNILLPRFKKIVEVSDPVFMALLRREIALVTRIKRKPLFNSRDTVAQSQKDPVANKKFN